MSPLKVEKESPGLDKEVFTVPTGQKYTLDLAAGRRVNLYGSLLGGRVQEIPDIKEPNKKTPPLELSIYTEPFSIVARLKHEKVETRFTFTGVLF